MTKNSDYPLFIPPGDLGERTPPEWSQAEAKTYARWLQSSMAERVLQLVRCFGMSRSASPTSLVEPLGMAVADVLVREPFSEEGRLTNRGHALGADMGLLLAEALLQQHSGLDWDIVRKPRSDVSYNQPVLVGFGGVPFDPIQVSTTQAFAILRGTKDGVAWRQVFDYWSKKAESG